MWKAKDDGRFYLFKTYPICSYSGGLGPKVSQGDRQAPEGFYLVSQEQMNPRSKYHLSFNVGFPNAYDRAYGRTGQDIMVHGDCTSAGCYAMTDAVIEEIFILAREALQGGQDGLPDPGLSVPHDGGEHGGAPEGRVVRFLEEPERGLRLFRDHASPAAHRGVREALSGQRGLRRSRRAARSRRRLSRVAEIAGVARAGRAGGLDQEDERSALLTKPLGSVLGLSLRPVEAGLSRLHAWSGDAGFNAGAGSCADASAAKGK